ncbi:MAG: hypothetical protein Q8P34_02020 [Bacteroidota bacterium]|nr:hypothetical protein [Bacteroidota bacterium]
MIRNFITMVAIRNIGFIFVFVLIVISQTFAFHSDCGSTSDFADTETSDSLPRQEIQAPVSSYLFAIKVNNYSQTITDKHRLVTVNILPNRYIPLNFDFRIYADFPIPTIYSSPVPIFIRGHALLN